MEEAASSGPLVKTNGPFSKLKDGTGALRKEK